jgi:sigma-B regulation protein RsbU (phosphoserine phosphatase)
LPPLFYDTKKQQLIHLEKGCIGLGMLDKIPKIEESTLKVPPNAKLIAFTDGLVEVELDNQIQSDTTLLEKFISNPDKINDNIAEIRQFINNNLDNNIFFDDITLIGLGFS